MPQPRQDRDEMPPGMAEGVAGRVLPLIITLAFHGALIIVLAIVVVSRPAQSVQEIGIDVSILSSAGSGTAGDADAASIPARSIRPAMPEAPAQPRVSGDTPQGVEIREVPLPMASAEAPAVPPGDMQVDDSAQESTASQPRTGEGIGWEGSARKLIRKRVPEFPAQLSSAGQEVECEARITVAASGVVTRVEITRSSGYIEIDASVEAALRDYLFSRANERKDTVGTIRFRFRLERQD